MSTVVENLADARISLGSAKQNKRKIKWFYCDPPTAQKQPSKRNQPSRPVKNIDWRLSRKDRSIDIEKILRPQFDDDRPGYLKIGAVLAREDDGYSAYVPYLPGCVSQGDNYGEAVANIQEALIDLIDTYKEQGVDVPYVSEPEFDEDGDDEELAILIIRPNG